MRDYREVRPGKTVSPKMHTLETHMVPFIEKFNCGLGRLSEPGGELIHATMVKHSNRTRGMKDPSKRIRSMIESHHVHNDLEIQTLIPKKKKRIFKNKNKNCTDD